MQVCFYIDENRPRESRHCDSSSLLPPMLKKHFSVTPGNAYKIKHVEGWNLDSLCGKVKRVV